MTPRTRMFIDFWNFQLSLNASAPAGYRMDWKAISPWLIANAKAAVGSGLAFEDTRVYVSTFPGRKGEAVLRDFALNVLVSFPGINVTLIRRKPRNPPVRPSCHRLISTWPHCASPVDRTIEKGVDTAMAPISSCSYGKARLKVSCSSPPIVTSSLPYRWSHPKAIASSTRTSRQEGCTWPAHARHR
jgi:hypothetical protein